MTDNNDDDHPSTPAPPRIQVDTPTTPPRTLRRSSIGLRSPVMSAFREHVTVDGDITPLTLDEVDVRSADFAAEVGKRVATESQKKWEDRSESERAEIAAKWRSFVEDTHRSIRESEERGEKEEEREEEEDAETEVESEGEGEKEKGEKGVQGEEKKAKWEFVGKVKDMLGGKPKGERAEKGSKE